MMRCIALDLECPWEVASRRYFSEQQSITLISDVVFKERNR